MKIGIIYATYSSGTLTVSEIIQEELQKMNHEPVLVNVADVDPSTLTSYDLTLMGSPTWWNNNTDGQPHHLYFELMPKIEALNLENKQFCIFGLGDSAYAKVCGSVDVLEAFVAKIKGKLKIPSLRVDSFYFDQKNNEEKVRKWAQTITS